VDRVRSPVQVQAPDPLAVDQDDLERGGWHLPPVVGVLGRELLLEE
jgi:hypothetical protein